MNHADLPGRSVSPRYAAADLPSDTCTRCTDDSTTTKTDQSFIRPSVGSKVGLFLPDLGQSYRTPPHRSFPSPISVPSPATPSRILAITISSNFLFCCFLSFPSWVGTGVHAKRHSLRYPLWTTQSTPKPSQQHGSTNYHPS